MATLSWSLVLFLALVAVVVAGYPDINTVPPVDSPEVVAWLKELNLAAAPNISVNAVNPATNTPNCPVNQTNTEKNAACHSTCSDCHADDIISCSAPLTWGLTFDDGPSEITPSLLDFLKSKHLKASFFLIGSNVINNTDTVKRQLAEGHHLASHTWSHTALTTLTNEQIVAEMKWTEMAVMNATGKRLKYMRPPYGDIDNRVRFVLKRLGYTPVEWTSDAFDTNDWKIPANATAEDLTLAATNFTNTMKKYVASAKTNKGFYALQHDRTIESFNLTQILIAKKPKTLNINNIPGCEGGASYQVISSNATTTARHPTGTPSGMSTVTPVVATTAVDVLTSVSPVPAATTTSVSGSTVVVNNPNDAVSCTRSIGWTLMVSVLIAALLSV
ncbi:chitin deacetylase [Dissophora globulifera]|nr:chitin deacetylase [Dissophora globulifera]